MQGSGAEQGKGAAGALEHASRSQRQKVVGAVGPQGGVGGPWQPAAKRRHRIKREVPLRLFRLGGVGRGVA